MKHIVNRHSLGNIEIDKDSLADITELIRISPTASRVLFVISNFADSTNSLISNVKTIAKVLGESKESVKYSLCKLAKEGFIDIAKIKINHQQDIFKYIHDKQKYDLTNGNIWTVIGTELVDTYSIDGVYNKFTVNSAVIKCSDNKINNVLLHAKGNLFYDTNIDNSEIIWEET